MRVYRVVLAPPLWEAQSTHLSLGVREQRPGPCSAAQKGNSVMPQKVDSGPNTQVFTS